MSSIDVCPRSEQTRPAPVVQSDIGTNDVEEATAARFQSLLSSGLRTERVGQNMQAELNRLWLRLDEVQAVAACLASIEATDDIAGAYAYEADTEPHNPKGACTDALARVLGVLAREAKRAHARLEKQAGRID